MNPIHSSDNKFRTSKNNFKKCMSEKKKKKCMSEMGYMKKIIIQAKQCTAVKKTRNAGITQTNLNIQWGKL